MMPNSTQPQTKPRTIALLALSAALLVSAALPAAPQTGPSDGQTITPNYKDADLSQIIQAVAEVTGKNFIIDPRVNAKVTMLSATPMSPAAFYEAFLSVLQVYGYVAVPAGKVIKIVPNTDARQLPANDLPQNVSATSDEIVTQVITLKNVSAAQLVPMLRPLIPQYGHLAPYATGNMLIISDRASNVNRLVRIIERIDEGGGDQPIEVIALHNASAADVVRIVTSLNQGQAAEGGGVGVKIVADERTNSILLTGDSRMQRLRTKALIINMDTPLATGGDTQVRYLRYADAEKIADKLKGQASASAKAQGGPSAAPTTGGGGTPNVDASVTIWADVATNALIITAPPKIMKSLMAVIDKLDIRRAQVQVEAVIAEIDVNKSANLGVQWILDGGNNYGYGVTNLPGSGTSIVNLAAAVLGATGGTTVTPTTGTTATGISSSTVGTGATFALGKYNSNTKRGFAALVQALRSDGSSNIISTPSLITMNNEEAEVKVTQEIPLITGSYSSSTAAVGGTTSPFTTIQREEVGTILKVTPHINEGNSVQLKIEQEDSSPGAKLTDSADISTNKRSIKTTVLIEDGGVIVLGGLMSDTVTQSEDRVPGLGAIPLLGNLFKSRSGSRQKKNLLVFIRPKILRDAEATESTSETKYDEVRQGEKSLGNGHIMLLPGQKQPVVPAIPPGSGLPAAPPPGANPQGATPNMPPPQSTPLPPPATDATPPATTAPPQTAAPPAAAPPATSPPP
ncbi:MAG TPA: type II secretion system secretin GspD [Steroidobacteraceae bacterium]|jgi:general secretion pathway protein D|nr:type II secretion system secretin GspD [Steroidobacteraceae bacterium]